MPTKFVAHAAERAGVSLETAEHRWAEAKKAITKGKRKGHWYWGKVMNTFKRMMGLMEAVTLKEWMMLETEPLDEGKPYHPEDEFIKGGYILHFMYKGKGAYVFGIKRLMTEEDIGRASIELVKISKDSKAYKWSIWGAGVSLGQTQTWVPEDSGLDAKGLAKWVGDHVHTLTKAKQ
jgi:hypothetical protein